MIGKFIWNWSRTGRGRTSDFEGTADHAGE